MKRAVVALLAVGFVGSACRPEPAVAPVPPASAAVTASPPATAAATVAPSPTVDPSAGLVPNGDNTSGLASWYGDALKGHKTASGERFDPSAMTAAHRTLPIGTWLEVTRPGTGLTVRVRINDRGPMSPKFIIDLSRGAAEKLGMVRMGVARVELRVLSAP